MEKAKESFEEAVVAYDERRLPPPCCLLSYLRLLWLLLLGMPTRIKIPGKPTRWLTKTFKTSESTFQGDNNLTEITSFNFSIFEFLIRLIHAGTKLGSGSLFGSFGVSDPLVPGKSGSLVAAAQQQQTFISSSKIAFPNWTNSPRPHKHTHNSLAVAAQS